MNTKVGVYELQWDGFYKLSALQRDRYIAVYKKIQVARELAPKLRNTDSALYLAIRQQIVAWRGYLKTCADLKSIRILKRGEFIVAAPLNDSLTLARAIIRSKIKAKRESLRILNTRVKYRNAGNYHTLPDSVHTQNGDFLTLYKNKMRELIYRNKSPNTRDNYIGVEIECFAPCDAKEMANAMLDAGVGKAVCVKGDGSICPDNTSRDACIGSDCCEECGDGDCCGSCNSRQEGIEVTVLFKENEMQDILGKVCKVLKNLHADVNSSCGLHVHLDARHRDAKSMVDRLVRAQELLYRMVPVARSKSSYCQPTKTKALYRTKTRYVGINSQAYSKYRTIEVRIHSGSTNYDKISNWVSLLLTVINTDYKRFPSTLRGIERTFKFNATLMEYIKERLTKFAKEHNKEGEPVKFLEPPKKRVVRSRGNISVVNVSN